MPWLDIRLMLTLLQFFMSSHHGCDLIESLQVLDDLGLVGWLHSGEAASLLDGVLLIVWRKVVKLTTSEGLAGDILILAEDANATADGHSGALVVTWVGYSPRSVFPSC